MIKLTIITYVTALPRTGEMDHQRLPEEEQFGIMCW
jgi:hypothetical protein